MDFFSSAIHCALSQSSALVSSGLDSGVVAALVSLSAEGSHNG